MLTANVRTTVIWTLVLAAIAGAGPLVGPVLAAQTGYLPGTVRIIAGVVLAGAVQTNSTVDGVLTAVLALLIVVVIAAVRRVETRRPGRAVPDPGREGMRTDRREEGPRQGLRCC